ncbi:glycosyltransferase family 4 protein [Quisquiliibacterium transsilvanicum]|uniref:Glycosyltransferase involved in cell wall biosynthesis n=1 Tax=Quisquiliibacterium transsilvanicum TaxID=1549638 RepID=A0A7W8M9E1_9BURK|nr:glycosyltransferase family 4 protein [Quisquiliibacterium transsilvanicum]MBB5272200.1 glycosyltransferase involved in cell wall biosynthesis [Quisquiliibacterium transsilvanicum]
MRVTLHDYATDPSLPQKDGVNLAHENIAALLKESGDSGLDVSFHDFTRLLVDEDYARRVLAEVDCVVSNVGPHAHYYFWLRQRLRLDFRILRDVRTAIWSSYLLQEHLCRAWLRPDDVLLVASHYTRGVYERIFPHLAGLPTVRCYPLSVGFPAAEGFRARDARAGARPRVIGYIGRLSEDKNFPDLVELLIRLNRADPGGYRLRACGDVHSPSCDPALVRQRIAAELGDGDWFEYLPARPNSGVWELYDRFDVLVFPSTSNLETLGRVLVEASHAGVPIVCGEHAAAPELVPAGALCRVHYAQRRDYSAHFDHSLGRVSLDDMQRVLAGAILERSTCHLEYLTHPDKFMRILRACAAGGRPEPEPLELAPAQRAFIGALAVDLPAPLEARAADALLARLARWFVSLQRQGTPEREGLIARLSEMSQHPERTSRFVRKTLGTSADFTDVGGIDIELCHVAGFYPSFRLQA